MLQRLNRPAPFAEQDDTPPVSEADKARARAKAFKDLAAHEKDVEAKRKAILEDIEKAQEFLRPFDEARASIRRGQEALRELQWTSERPKLEAQAAIRQNAPAVVHHVHRKASEASREIMTSTVPMDVDDRKRLQARTMALHELRKRAESLLEKPISDKELADIERQAKEVLFA